MPAHEICASLGLQKSLAVPVFHAFTGCDTVSQFAKVGKKSAWKVWATHVTNSLPSISSTIHHSKSEKTEAALEYFTILLYDIVRTSTCTSINEARKLLFTHTKKGRQMSSLLPTMAALQQHIRRAVLQGGHIWASTYDAISSNTISC